MCEALCCIVAEVSFVITLVQMRKLKHKHDQSPRLVWVGPRMNLDSIELRIKGIHLGPII